MDSPSPIVLDLQQQYMNVKTLGAFLQTLATPPPMHSLLMVYREDLQGLLETGRGWCVEGLAREVVASIIVEASMRNKVVGGLMCTRRARFTVCLHTPLHRPPQLSDFEPHTAAEPAASSERQQLAPAAGQQ